MVNFIKNIFGGNKRVRNRDEANVVVVMQHAAIFSSLLLLGGRRRLAFLALGGAAGLLAVARCRLAAISAARTLGAARADSRGRLGLLLGGGGSGGGLDEQCETRRNARSKDET